MSLTLPREAWDLADDFYATFTTEAGRRTLRALEQASGIFTALPAGPVDLGRAVYVQGRRDLYLFIRERLAEAAVKDREMGDKPPRVINAWGDEEPS